VTAIPASVELGKFLRRRMEDLGMTKADLAEELGWGPRTVQRVFTGNRPLYDEGEVIQFARYLDIPERELWAFLTPPDGPGQVSLEQVVERIRDLEAQLEELRRGRPDARAPSQAPGRAAAEPRPEGAPHVPGVPSASRTHQGDAQDGSRARGTPRRSA
jgi:transcriptional regulator with XRE-family HTH domain